ncbi:MAG: hypothetical protein ABIK26_01750 [Candidatus Omnitrophota bacterium]
MRKTNNGAVAYYPAGHWPAGIASAPDYIPACRQAGIKRLTRLAEQGEAGVFNH